MSEPKHLKASTIIRRLINSWVGASRGLVMQNYTPRAWWECDVFELTEAGYLREYEVKLTRSDFRADADKQRDSITKWDSPSFIEKKHDLLAAGDPRGPKQFWYVCPAGVLGMPDIPRWAGFIEFTAEHRFVEHRPAPILHRSKANEKIRQDVLECCYHRMHIAIDRLHARGIA